MAQYAGRIDCETPAYQVVGFGMTLYLLFFFLRDRRIALQALRWLSPLSRTEMNYLFHRVNDTICATIHGTLSVAVMQGVLGGLMFWWLGMEAPLLWGLVMGLLAVVPVLGAFVVWIPAALFLAAEGNWGKAMILFLWGMRSIICCVPSGWEPVSSFIPCWFLFQWSAVWSGLVPAA